MEQALDFLNGLRPSLIYVVLSGGAAIENLFPVLPADTFIVTGGFLAGLKVVSPAGLFLAVWACNTGGAIAVYGAGLKYGPKFFRTDRVVILSANRRCCASRGSTNAGALLRIFAARFLPGFRALVPVFAGVTKQGWSRVVPPLLVASAIWYGGLVRIGYLAGENLEAVLAALGRTNRGLLFVSLALALIGFGAWWRLRRSRTSPGDRRAPKNRRGPGDTKGLADPLSTRSDHGK